MSDAAVKIMEPASDEIKNTCLNFNAGNKVYGVEIRHVFQIIGL